MTVARQESAWSSFKPNFSPASNLDILGKSVYCAALVSPMKVRTNGSEEVILPLISKFWEDKQGFLLTPLEPGSFKRNSAPGTCTDREFRFCSSSQETGAQCWGEKLGPESHPVGPCDGHSWDGSFT